MKTKLYFLTKLFLILILLLGLVVRVGAQTNILVADDAAVITGSTASDGLFQINRNSALGLDIINRTALGLNVVSEMSFRTNTSWTGSIKTIGLNATDARMGFFTGANGTRSNLVERFSINNDGNFALNFGTGAGVLGYMNFGNAFGVNGFGIRSNAGIMEYRHNSDPVGSWTSFPPSPAAGNVVEWWLRLTAGNYIYPQLNSNIHIYDPGQVYGIYYDGATNQYGMYSRTSSATSPTSAVVGFSDVVGNQTYGYLGYNGTWTAPTAGFGSIFGSAVYGIVDDPGRTAGFFRTTGAASYAANIAYSDVWVPGFFYGDYNNAAYNSRPAIYGSMNTHFDVANNQPGIWGRSEYLAGTTANLGTTIGGYFQGVGNEQDAFGIYSIAFSDAFSAGGYFQGDLVGTDCWKNDDLTAGIGYGYNQNYYGTRGVALSSIGSDTVYYNYGVYGLFGDLGVGYAERSGGVMGYVISSVDAWGVLGYVASNNNIYGLYSSTVYGNGGGKLEGNIYSGTGVAGNGDLFGAWFNGELYGMAVKGERMGLYVDGKTFTNNIITQMNDNGNNDRIPTYVPTSMTVDIYMKGTAKLVNGKATIQFDDKYLSLISDKEPIVVTVTPMGKTAGVYIEEVKSNGFTIVENNDGKSNVTFSWIAIATRKGYENPDNPVELISSEYDTHLSDFMFNESDTLHSGKPMWWDGTKIRFDNLPDKPKENDLKNGQPLKISGKKTHPISKNMMQTKLEKDNKMQPIKSKIPNKQ